MTTIIVRTTFPFYHSQIFENYCGPACAQMILESLSITRLAQTDIAAAGTTAAPSTGANTYDDWSTRPDELVNMLQALAPVIDRTFAPQTSNTSASFRTLLKRLVENVNISPPVTPIHGNAHWVVFFQYRVNSRKKSFHGYDPIYYGVNGDVATPSAPVEIDVADQKGNFPNFITIVKSPTPVALATVSEAGHEAPVAVAIKVPLTSGEEYNYPQEQGDENPDPPASDYSKRFPPKKIPQQAIEELIAYGVIDQDDPNGILTDISPGAPLWVKVPDAPGESYYLIGLQDSSNKNRFLTRLDGYDGQYLDSLSIPRTEYLLGKSAIGSKMYKKVYEQLVIKRKKESWFRAFETELSRTNLDGVEEPNLIWKPCNESQSPFYPFYEVRDGLTTFYVRIDGAVFPNLTTTRREGKPPTRK